MGWWVGGWDDVLEKLRDLFPPSPDGDHMPAPNPANGLDVDVRARILAAIPKVFRTLPRRSGPALSGSRFEHWVTIRDSDEGVRLAAELLVRLIEGNIYRRRLSATRNLMTRTSSCDQQRPSSHRAEGGVSRIQ